MAQNHARTESGHSQPNSPIFSIAHLPMAGRFPLSVLASEFIKAHKDTVRRWIIDNNCPYKQPGDEMWIDVVDLWNSWPYQKPDETPKRRGGFRRPKD